jgi:predicted transport protein
MSDLKLFSLQNNKVTELKGQAAALEKDLQHLIEANMESFLGVRFLAREYTTGKTHKGRIDSLGLDENNAPVIIEYKRHQNENVINQGLFYLDWLMDHQAEFQLLTQQKLGTEAAEQIEWTGTRLICIANGFNHYDEHAVQQIERNIDLMRYRYFGDDLLALELVHAHNAGSIGNAVAKKTKPASSTNTCKPGRNADKTQAERLAQASPELTALYDSLCTYAEQLGDDVQRKELKLYTAFKLIKNFVCIVVLPQKKDPRIQLTLKLPGEDSADGFTQDVSQKGHWGTGDLLVDVRNTDELERAKALILKSYENA